MAREEDGWGPQGRMGARPKGGGRATWKDERDNNEDDEEDDEEEKEEERRRPTVPTGLYAGGKDQPF